MLLFTLELDNGDLADLAFVEQYALEERDDLTGFPRVRRLPRDQHVFVFVRDIARHVLIQPEVWAPDDDDDSHFLNDVLDVDIFYRMEMV